MPLARIIAVHLFVMLLGVTTAEASIYSYSDRLQFEGMGAISENYGFEDFGPYSTSPGDPWTTHGVTYTSGGNNYVFIGPLGSKPPAVSNVLVSNSWLSLSGNLDGGTQYNMLGFDLAVLFATAVPGNITLSIYTNQAAYSYGSLGLPDVSYGQEFFGFVANGDEYFTGFNLTSDTWGTAGALDNVTLGTTVVPVPSAVLLFSSGLISLVGISLTARSSGRLRRRLA